MRCPSCHRDNDADRLFCVQCAAELVAGAAREIEPPRASGRRARLALHAARCLRASWDDRFYSLERRFPNRSDLVRSVRRLALTAASALPGTGHLLLGRRREGVALALGFAVAVGTWVLLMGTWFAAVMWLTAISLIAASVADCQRLDDAREGRGPWHFGLLLLGISVAVGMYALALGVVSMSWQRVVVNLPIVRLAAPGRQAHLAFSPGERVLFARAAYRHRPPQRGDVVLVRHRRIMGIQRVLAVEGDHLEFVEGELRVNRSPAEERLYPLEARGNVRVEGAVLVRGGWSGFVPAGRCVVWEPELVANVGPQVGPVLVPEAEVLGKAWRVYSPHGRRRLVDHGDPAPSAPGLGGDDGP